jgi:hypothetical protein
MQEVLHKRRLAVTLVIYVNSPSDPEENKMSVTVHMRNGQINEHKAATSCIWKSIGSSSTPSAHQPRWLICTNEKGDVIASYQESEINGFRPQTVKRFSFPSVRRLRD